MAMPARRTHKRLTFDEPAVGPLDVKVYSPDGTLIRIIPGALLMRRKLSRLSKDVVIPPRDEVPHVPRVKAKTRAGRP